MLRGEIWWAKWPTDPTLKPRPVLIVSNNLRNASPHLLDIVVVKLTSRMRDDGSKKPVNAAEDVLVTLKKETIIRCGAIFTIEKLWLQKSGGQLAMAIMNEVDEKLKRVLNLF